MTSKKHLRLGAFLVGQCFATLLLYLTMREKRRELTKLLLLVLSILGGIAGASLLFGYLTDIELMDDDEYISFDDLGDDFDFLLDPDEAPEADEITEEIE